MRSEKTACILCSRNCGLTIDIADNGHFSKIRGDEDHPISKGYICQKAARLEYYQHHEDRLQYPLKRLDDGSFVRVSWDEALDDIAHRLIQIREQHGGNAFATAGGGGQGNHLGGAYLSQLRAAMKSRFNYNSLGQEKTGDFWVNGRLFGSQTCHTTEDVEHADFVLFIGCNPFQAHGIPNARDTLKEIRKNPHRTMVVIDPRRTETAKQADIHLQLKPSTDAFLMSAILALIIRANLHDRDFIAQHCTGYEDVEKALLTIPIEEYVARADVPLADVERVAYGFAKAKRACVRIDLGIQHSLNTTLNGYLEKLLYLITGNFGIKGGNNLHAFLLPILSNTDERKKKLTHSVYHDMFPISGILPPSIMPDEILLAGEQRIRAVIVDSCNPLLTWPDTAAFDNAFRQLELLVVVDVALTETARLAHYVLPAASQFEKWECTGFNLEFPRNAFHLRHPILPALGESLPEPEIYTRLLEKMRIIPRTFPLLSRIARYEPKQSHYLAYTTALFATLAHKKHWQPYAVSILYRTLGANLAHNAAAAAFILPLAIQFAQEHHEAMQRAGFKGNRITLGAALFNAILEQRSGVVFSEHRYSDVWSLIKNKDRRIYLAIPEMLAELNALAQQQPHPSEFPFILAAGERRSYNANQIYRDPAWRKVDKEGALRIHPADAARLNIQEGEQIRCRSAQGELRVMTEFDEGMRQGCVSLPHGYGLRFRHSEALGPALNLLTASTACDPFSRTPYHKYVPVSLEKL
ncbi:molybdopterin-dependent oxidoreductase [Agitococcus lubricus]|uniref:Anaerobic selenocysteine-containing dehydrogenase n=1 Tax=Agitococcus lubricus TaxID=1077255 RepID=A0A2T5IUY0_9GAMM|nr:molybdopterin-dependent oxidoreductase [Agitococcus lubricus]PTQ87685.1 anaerobic selenocysteine-containing dehydrogenase [Agitococcus lubricus]